MNKMFKGFTRLFLVMALILAGVLAVPSMKAEAARNYPDTVSRIQQTYMGTNQVSISWTPASNSSNYYAQAAGYNIYVGTENAFDHATPVGQASSTDTSYTISNLADGTEYCVWVVPYAAGGATPSYVSYTRVETIPATIKNFHQAKWWYILKSLDVEWDKSNADSYEVKLYNYKGKCVATQNLNGYSHNASFSHMKDEVYTVTVRASKNVNGQTYWTPVSRIQCFNQARIKSLKAKKGKLTIKWGKVGGATGYDIYVSTSPKSGYKKVKTLGKKKSSFTLKKFKGKKINGKKKYYVVVETRKGANKSGKLYYWTSNRSNFGYLI